MYVYYNYTRVLCVLCECHGYRCDCESSRVPIKMLKCLSQKIRKLQSYVRSCLSKNKPKSWKVHDHIKNNATQKKSTHKTRVRFVKKIRRKPILVIVKKSSPTVDQQSANRFFGELFFTITPIFRSRNVNSSMRYVYDSSRDKHGKKYLKYLRFFSCNFPYSE